MSFVSVHSFAKHNPTSRRHLPRVADIVSFAVRLPSGQPYINISIGEQIMDALGWKQGDKVDARIDNDNGRLMFVKAEKGLTLRSPVSEKGVPCRHGCVSFPVYADICVSPAKLVAEPVEFSVSPEGLILDIPEAALKNGE